MLVRLRPRRNPERERARRSTKIEDENFALIGKGNKAKGKKGQGKAKSSQKGEEKEKDLSKIKCFHCNEFEHYATKCPNWKKGSNKDHVAASAEVDGFFTQSRKISH